MWRQRQMRRAASQLQPVQNDSLVHAPFCIELTQGLLGGLLGSAASRRPSSAICFCIRPRIKRSISASSTRSRRCFKTGPVKASTIGRPHPIDNPDYEQFMVDFHDRTAVFPQTTTALALKEHRTHPPAARALARKRAACAIASRSGAQAAPARAPVFTPEELLFLEMVMQNKESTSPKVNAGRAGEREERAPVPRPDRQPLRGGTIACVSGFLINMVNRSLNAHQPLRGRRSLAARLHRVRRGDLRERRRVSAMCWSESSTPT